VGSVGYMLFKLGSKGSTGLTYVRFASGAGNLVNSWDPTLGQIYLWQF
jgi:hypothetical protein